MVWASAPALIAGLLLAVRVAQPSAEVTDVAEGLARLAMWFREGAPLLQRSNEDAFVIFAEKCSGKFVQFSGDDQDLLFDLPFQTLDQAEARRADADFREIGVQAAEYDDAAGRQRSFQKPFGRDVDAAAGVSMQVFERVYRFPRDFELLVTEN